ncbi:hypothetical protein D3C87_1828310 [compost metagenome]
MMGDPVAHGVECPRRMGHLARTGLADRLALGIRIKRIGGGGEIAKRPECLTHNKPGAEDEQQHLHRKDIRQPAGQRHHTARCHVDRKRGTVGKRQMTL